MELKTSSWAEINLDNIGYNLEAIKNSLENENIQVCAVVKANAYGCGAVTIGKYLEKKGVDYLAVARIEEGLELRKNDITLPILILGFTDDSYVKYAINENLTITVYNLDYAKKINIIAKELNKKVKIHIKIDTGMSRIGFISEDCINDIKEINLLENIEIEGIYTHFARADEKNKNTTIIQYKKFKKVLSSLENENILIKIKHCANSAAIIDFNDDLLNMVRLGISLYGYYPSDEVDKKEILLKPCFKLKSKITNVKILDENIGISYGHNFKTNEKSKIITISIGYADGFNRHQKKPKVLIKGKIYDIVGRICMDQCMAIAPLDADVSIGEDVTIIDNDIKELKLEEHAIKNETINYEILCMINRRVCRMYTENNKSFIVNFY